jgi:protein-S-isoprenylcysteine O-methyltransferase Ste14
VGVSFIVLTIWTIYFYQRDPQVLARRLLGTETTRPQKLIMLMMKLRYVFALVLAGLDYRLGWTRKIAGPAPWWLVLLALFVILVGHVWIFAVLKASRFAAIIIQVEASQTVADTGLYRVVRHPMYPGGMVMWWLATPLALESYVALLAFALPIPVVVLRLLKEEKVLRRELPGYAEYCQSTRYRLIPFIR